MTVDYFCQLLETGGDWAKRSHELAVENGLALGWQPPTREQYDEAQSHFANRLRAYVDQWVDSGLRRNGGSAPGDPPSEEPQLRSLGPASLAELDPSLTEHMTLTLRRSGQIQIAPTVHGFGENLSCDMHPVHQAKRDAAQRFLLFLQSPWAFKFAKCRKCGKYFGSNRKLHPVYKRGIHCPQCRNKVTAIAAQNKSKAKFRERWISIAAKAWRRWTPKNGDKIIFVVSEVNKKISPMKIARNSVSLHRAEIERSAQENSGRSRKIDGHL